MSSRRTVRMSPAVMEDDRARKRRKQSGANQPNDGPGAGLAAARELFGDVWNYQERHRLFRQHFEVLPSRDDYPDYYVKIKNPISLFEVKRKLDAGRYTSLDEIKADLLLMCENATTYNKTKSQLYNDSVRLRELVINFIPMQASGRRREDSAQTVTAPTPARKATRTARAGTSVIEKLQQAQAQIIDDMMGLTNDNGGAVAYYFIGLPNKKAFPDYYQLIKEPLSLTQIKRKIKDGQYPRWADLEQAVLLIRRNAETYNDHSSDIVRDVRALEQFFYKRLTEERTKVPDGTPQSSGIKLRLNVGGNHHSTPQASSHNSHQTIPASAPPKINIKIKNRQSTPRSITPATAASPPAMPVQAPAQSAQSSTSPPLTVKEDTSATQAGSSDALHNLPDVSAVKLANNDLTPQPAQKAPTFSTGHASHLHPQPAVASKSPRKAANGTHAPASEASITVRSKIETSQTPTARMSPTATTLSSMPPPPLRLGDAPIESATPSSYSPLPAITTSPQLPAATPVPEFTRTRPAYSYSEPTLRAEGMDASTAYITNLRVSSNTDSDYTQNLKPHDHNVTVQYTLHPSSEHAIITLTPTLSPEIMARQYNLTVHHKVAGHSTKLIQTSAARQKKKEEPPFDVQLAMGVTNTVEVTVVTKTPEGQKSGIGGWDMERFRLFIYVI